MPTIVRWVPGASNASDASDASNASDASDASDASNASDYSDESPMSLQISIINITKVIIDTLLESAQHRFLKHSVEMSPLVDSIVIQ